MSHSILIVETEAVLSRNLKIFFERAGHQVRCADSTAAAERKLDDAFPELLILGHDMPRLDGIGWLREIKRHNAALPVVIVSTEATVELAVRAIRSGASEFLTKPVSLAKLRQVAGNLLSDTGVAPPPHQPGRPERVQPHSLGWRWSGAA